MPYFLSRCSGTSVTGVTFRKKPPSAKEQPVPVFARPGQPGSVVSYASRYDNIIGGEYVAPTAGQYFENPSPVTGQTFCEIARSTAEDVELALDAAHRAAPAWGKTTA